MPNAGMTISHLSPPSEWKRHVRSAMIQVASLAHWSLVQTRSWCADSPLARVRLAGKLNRAENEVALLLEELRIKDARMTKILPHNRPFYPATERLAILELKAARAWNLAQTARAFLVEPETVAEWMKRSDQEGDDALVLMPEPVNKYPDFVCQVVQRLNALCPLMGKRRIADTLAKAGLHLAATTVRRMLKDKPVEPATPPVEDESTDDPPVGTPSHVVTARHPNHVWHVDLTVVPTSAGFWTAWFPFSLLQVWPFCYWVAVAMDHFSRKVVGFAVFKKPPSSEQVRTFLGTAMYKSKAKPRHIISDKGPQFWCAGFKKWAKRKKINLRFGAVGKRGSIALIERFIRSMKSECFGVILVPFRLSEMREELGAYVTWFNERRPHQGLAGRTPSETAADIAPVRPQYETRGKTGVKLKLVVSHFQGRKHLPIVELQKVA